MPDEAKQLAGIDRAAGIGYGQTISQPTTVKRMLKWLDVQPGNKVLDVGSGSGWATALLAYLTGPRGMVYAVERVPELLEFGQSNFEITGMKNAKFHQAGEQLGWPKEAPYDRILVSASTGELPQELVDQLKPGGKMVIPIEHDILEITKNSNDTLDKVVHHGYVFVPLITD